MNCSKTFLTLLLLTLIGTALQCQPAKAAPTAAAYTDLIYTFSDDLHGVDVTTNGTVFATASGDVYRSDDFGLNWTKVLDGVAEYGWVFFIRVDSQDRIFAATGNLSNYKNDIWRSSNYGVSWTKVLEDVPRIWRMAEMSNGTLLINTYSPYKNDAAIYKSATGSTWSLLWNMSALVPLHLHTIRVDPYNDDIWVTTGDTLGSCPILVWRSGATAWETFNTGGLYTDVLFDSEWIYFIPDTAQILDRVRRDGGTWAQRQNCINIVSDDTTSPAGVGYAMMGAMLDNGLLVVGTDRETMLASVDGARWLKIYQTTYAGSGAWRYCYISQRTGLGYWYFINEYNSKLYRSYVTTDIVSQIIGRVVRTDLGGQPQTNAYWIPAANGSIISMNFTDFTLPRYMLSMKGLSQGNFMSNPSFESGTTAGWKFGNLQTGDTYQVTTSDKYDGSYSLQINKTDVGDEPLYFEFLTPMTTNVWGESWFFSYFGRVIPTVDITEATTRIDFGYYNSLGNWISYTFWDRYPVETWGQQASNVFRRTTTTTFYVRIWVFPSFGLGDYTVYFDALIWERKACTYILKKVNNGDTTVYKTPVGAANPSASTVFYNGTVKTANITLPMKNGLNDWTQPSPSFTGDLDDSVTKDFFYYPEYNGVFEILVNCSGSKQVWLILTFRSPPTYTDELVVGAVLIGSTATAVAWGWRRYNKTRKMTIR